MGYRKELLSILFIGLLCQAKAQEGFFRFPLDTTPLLSGTFGEFRGNHFHAGIDIKTYGKTGLPVYATANGYVSRIKISPYGYGKAIYLTHDNGYTSVYGHLSGFNPELDAYIRKHQYEKKSYSIELFPGKTQFKVNQGDLIALSGNSGGSYAPHLHFELRDTRTQEILDPLSFSLPVIDTLPPVLKAIRVLHRNREYKIANGFHPLASELNTFGKDEGTIELPAGEYSLILAAQDFLVSDTSNVLGVHQVLIMEGTDALYRRETDRFAFSDSKFIRLISDYEEGYPPLENCFIEKWQDHRMATYQNDGWIHLDSLNPLRKFDIILRDQYGNEALFHLNLAWNNSTKLKEANTSSPSGYEHAVIYENEFSFNLLNGTYLIDFFKNSFFDTLRVHCRIIPGDCDTLELVPNTAYVGDRFRIVYSVPQAWRAKKSKLCLARKTIDGPEFIGNNYLGDQISGYSRHFGEFYLFYDSLAPQIGEPEVRGDSLFIHIQDDFSGIDKYIPRINDRWFLMEYDPKAHLLFGDLSGFQKNEKLDFSLFVKDHSANSAQYKTQLAKP